MKVLVTVCLSAILAITPGGALHAQNVSALYVFGDSLSDTGNLFRITSLLNRVDSSIPITPPDPPYADGRFSNGPLYIEGLARLLGVRYDQDDSFAIGGTLANGDSTADELADLGAQVDGFLQLGGDVDPDAVYVVFSGSNDYLRSVQSVTDVAALANNTVISIADAVRDLAQAGARWFLVPNLPSLGDTPRARTTRRVVELNAASNAHNERLVSAMQSLRGELGVAIGVADTQSLFDEALTNPTNFGFTNTTEPCYVSAVATGACITAAAADASVFFDDLHPTRTAHAALASFSFAALIEEASLIGQSPLVSALLPTSRSVQIGTAATAFLSAINSGSNRATDCSIVPARFVPGSFSYRATDPGTNLPTGTANARFDIEAGQLLTFVTAFMPTSLFPAASVELRVDCANTTPAPRLTGVNTLLFSAEVTPVVDVIALVATASGNGILDIPGPSATGAFGVAIANVGAAGTITVSASPSASTLPLSALVCETRPADGSCIEPPSTAVNKVVASNDTGTFSVFVVANGEVPFDPAQHRIFFRLTDDSDVVRGESSVAVRTL